MSVINYILLRITTRCFHCCLRNLFLRCLLNVPASFRRVNIITIIGLIIGISEQIHLLKSIHTIVDNAGQGTEVLGNLINQNP